MAISLDTVVSSNAHIKPTFPTRQVAVFVGATAGIGEYTILEFAKCALGWRIYFVGRSEADGRRVKVECDRSNPEGKCVFIRKDVSLIKNVDEVCREIISREDKVNLLFMTQGTLDMSSVTSDGLKMSIALMLYSRTRFILDLLPHLRAAGDDSLARVVSVATGTHEGPVDLDDLDMKNISLLHPLKARGQAASMITLSLEHIARRAHQVSFVHSHPGPVYSKIDRTFTGWLFPLKWLIRFLMLFKSQSAAESGARHVFLATSTRWPAAKEKHQEIGMSSNVNMPDAVGINGERASGVYSVDEVGRSAGAEVVNLLKKYRGDGSSDRVWQHIEQKLVSTTGSPAI